MKVFQLKNLIWEFLFRLPDSVSKWIFNNPTIWKLRNKGFFSINNLDRKLLEFLPSRPGYFLEIGGNDGFSQSNTKHLEMYLGWEGLLVEPYEPNYRRIKITRGKGTKAVHGACVPFDFLDKSLTLTYGDLMTVSTGLRTTLADPEEHIRQSKNYVRFGKVATIFEAPALKLQSILENNHAPKVIDFFSLDVEGAEMAVLAGVNHQEYRFRYLLVETGQFREVCDFLSGKKYKFLAQLSGHDYLFCDSSQEP